MTLNECFDFAKANPSCAVATCEGDQPRVRIFMLWRADETGFYLCTGTPKAVCQQLMADPKTELCFYKPGVVEGEMGVMMRVSGDVEFVKDTAIREQLLNEWPFLRMMGISGPDDPMLSLCRIPTGEIKCWTADGPGKENVETVKF